MSRIDNLFEQLHSYAELSCIEGRGLYCTYSNLLQEIKQWQLRFEEWNIAPGSLIGLRADYSISAIAALLAILSRGRIAALIPRDRDVDRYLLDAHASACLDVNNDGTYQLHSRSYPEDHPLLKRLRAKREGGVVIFTSGSTGHPKAALQSLEQFLSKFSKPGRCLRTLAFLLFDHIGGLDTLFYTLSSGGTLILTSRRDPESIRSLVQSHRIEVLPASPSFLRLLCLSRDDRRHDLSSIKIITYGSEPMDENTLAQLNMQFPSAQISQKYGTTETGSPRTISRANDSLWLKIKSYRVETKIVDDVLWIRSEGAMLGYLNADSPVDDQGWYCTGDLVDVDGDWIRFRGRVADTINVGGEKVSPAEVEGSILKLDFVSSVLVQGEPHALVGQIVTATVSLVPEALDPKEAVRRIRRHCREHLPSYKTPIKIHIARGGFTNDRQKVQRHLGMLEEARVRGSEVTDEQRN